MTCAQAKEQMAALIVDGDLDFRRHLGGCVSCRREADELERSLRALGKLAGAAPPADDLFLAAVRRGYDEAKTRRSRGRWRLPLATVGLAAAAALLALLGPRPLHMHAPAPLHFEDADSGDEDACELVGDLDHDEVVLVQAKYGKGT